MWWKQNKWKVIITLGVVVLLLFTFWYGGNAPGLQGWTVGGDKDKTSISENVPNENDNIINETVKNADKEEINKDNKENINKENLENKDNTNSSKDKDNKDKENKDKENKDKDNEGIQGRPGGLEGGMTAEEKLAKAKELAGGSSPGVEKGDKEYSEKHGMVIDKTTGKDKYLTDPVPEGKPLPQEPQNTKISDKEGKCTLSISCVTILDNMDWLDPNKKDLVPSDGWILKPTEVTFYEGESVFNILLRTCKQNKIHMEFENTPMYNSAYIEGINNLYEFDCGELSGWMYSVNDWFPNYGCSRYALKNGDNIEWKYTCDLGVDVGGYYSLGG